MKVDWFKMFYVQVLKHKFLLKINSSLVLKHFNFKNYLINLIYLFYLIVKPIINIYIIVLLSSLNAFIK